MDRHQIYNKTGSYGAKYATGLIVILIRDVESNSDAALWLQ